MRAGGLDLFGGLMMTREVVAFSWNDASHAACRIFYISPVTWNQMDMNMGYGLPCGLTDIDPYIKTIWLKTLLQ